MYEKLQGTARLVNALHDISPDKLRITRIAQATNYLESQLEEDIQALYDYMKDSYEYVADKIEEEKKATANTKKSFKNDNPALRFISSTDTEETSRETNTSIPVVSKLTPPAGYKINPAFIETKSKRVQLLLQPSTVEAIKALAKKQSLSMNEAINEAIQTYLQIKGE